MRKGFTLIEIVLVIGILGILTAFLVAVLNPFEQFKKAADSKRKSDLAQIQRALESFNQDYGRYPTSSNADKIEDQGSNEIDWGTDWSPYIEVLPKDSSVGKTYVYLVSPDRQSYWLYASLDRGLKDLQVCNPDGNPATDDACTNSAGASCGNGYVCNYGVSSPNVSP